MKFRLGFLGAWALFVIALGAAAFVSVAEIENFRDARRLTGHGASSSTPKTSFLRHAAASPMIPVSAASSRWARGYL